MVKLQGARFLVAFIRRTYVGVTTELIVSLDVSMGGRYENLD